MLTPQKLNAVATLKASEDSAQLSQGGRGAEVSVSSTSRIGDLKIAAQKSLQQGVVELFFFL